MKSKIIVRDITSQDISLNDLNNPMYNGILSFQFDQNYPYPESLPSKLNGIEKGRISTVIENIYVDSTKVLLQKMYYDDSDVRIDFSTFTYLDDDNILRIIDMENGVAKINFIITSIINCDWVGLKELLSPPLDKAYLIEDNSYVNEYNDIYKIYLQNNKLYGDIYLWPTDRLLSLLSNPYIKYFNYIE